MKESLHQVLNNVSDMLLDARDEDVLVVPAWHLKLLLEASLGASNTYFWQLVKHSITTVTDKVEIHIFESESEAKDWMHDDAGEGLETLSVRYDEAIWNKGLIRYTLRRVFYTREVKEVPFDAGKSICLLK